MHEIGRGNDSKGVSGRWSFGWIGSASPTFNQYIRLITVTLIISMTGSTRATIAVAATPPSTTAVDSEVAPPEGWDNFASNLGSDLAPLLALFGEQVTKQYLGESLGMLDSLLFALAPLGIITAIVAAIRVAGKPWLRSLVGRAKESRGDVEADLMSSTSLDVCELWNGDGIVRVLGSPVLLHLIHVDEGPAVAGSNSGGSTTEDTAGIYTFHEAIKLGLYQTKDSHNTNLAASTMAQPLQASTDPEMDDEAYADIEDLRSRENPPNLSLNVSTKPLHPHILISLVVFGFLLQGGVMVYGGASQYWLKLRKYNSPPIAYGFPLFASGTVILALGMFGCAWAVESSTKEATWKPAPGGGSKSVIWLQQGGQTVGDQRFESWARRSESPDNTITTSHKSTEPTIEEIEMLDGEIDMLGIALTRWGDVTRMPKKLKGRTSLVNASIAFAFFGFVLQFFGLRVMHSSVTLAQLGAILLMTLIRCVGHITRDRRNDIKNPEQVEGYELDWLSKDLKRCETWEVITGPVDDVDKVPTDAVAKAAMDVMRVRARLARLSKDWNLESRANVEILQHVIEATMNEVFHSMQLEPEFKNTPIFEWAIPVKAIFRQQAEEHEQAMPPTPGKWEIKLTMERTRDENSDWKDWKTDRSELEAVLCLWTSSLTNVNRLRAKKHKPRMKQIRLLGLATDELKVDYRLWIHRGVTPKQIVLDNDQARYFGQSMCFNRGGDMEALGRHPNSEVSTSAGYLAVAARGALETVCAQELYTLFLSQLLAGIKDVGGTTARRADESTARLSSNDGWAQFRLNNTSLSLLAEIFSRCGLGTVEEAYFCIIPAFRTVNKLPAHHEAYSEACKTSKRLAQEGQWERCTEIDSWLYKSSKRTHVKPLEDLDIAAEISARLLHMTTTLVAEYKAKDFRMDDSLHRMWHTAYMLCRTITEASEDLGDSIVNLLLVYIRSELALPELDQEGVLLLAYRLVRDLDYPDSKKERAAYLITHLARGIEGTSVPYDLIERFSSVPEPPPHDLVLSPFEWVTKSEHPQVPMALLLVRGYITPLQLVAGIGNVGVVQNLLDAGAEINAAPAHSLGRTALQAAAGAGHKQIVSLLLKAQANVNAPPAENYGRTALQAAAEGGHRTVVQLLVAAGADVNAPPAGNGGRTALQAAAEGGHNPVVEVLLNAKVDVDSGPAKISGRTAMEAAVKGGHIQVVELLLAAGADINSPVSGDGQTPLEAAAEVGHKELVELLLRAKADVNSPNPSSGRTALQAAVEGSQMEVVKVLLAANADVNAAPGGWPGRTALQAAAAGGHTQLVELLLAAGADVNAPAGNYGRTALLAAAQGGHTVVVKLLLASKASVNIPLERSRQTALQVAVDGGHILIVKMLLAAGADVNAAPSGWPQHTALQAAARGGNKELVRLLLHAGADVNSPAMYNGQTALQAAASRGHNELVDILLLAKASVKGATSIHENTALKAAALGGHTGIVTALLLAQANGVHMKRETEAITEENTDTTAFQLGEAWLEALDLAAAGGHKELVESLLVTGAGIEDPLSFSASSFLSAAGVDPRLVACFQGPGFGIESEFARPRYNALQAAASGGHIEVVEVLLQARMDVNGPCSTKTTALQAAAKSGHAEVVELLIRAKADVNAPPVSVDGVTALHAAVQGGHKEVVDMLLSAKADPNFLVPRYGSTPLQEAAQRGHTEIVELLLAAKAKVNAIVHGGLTALHRAVDCGHMEAVEHLLAAKADVNLPSGGSMVLQVASRRGHTKIAELLLAAKANVNAGSEFTTGLTALQAAASGGYITLVQLLLAAGANVDAPALYLDRGQTALQGASGGGHQQVVELLLEANANINYQSARGWTALHAAAWGGHKEIAARLLAAQAEVYLQTTEGYTPLHLAAWGGHGGAVELLLAGKADADSRTTDGRTALLIAISNGHYGVIKQLLAVNADLNARTNANTSALMLAAVNGHKEVVELLLASNPDVNASQTCSGCSALQWAASNGHKEVVKLLLAAKADVNSAVCMSGKSALQWAASSGDKELVEILLAAGADVNAPAATRSIRTALQEAAGGGHREVVNILLKAKADINAPPVHGGITALQAAAKHGHKEVVEILLAADASVNAPQTPPQGATALQMASVNGHMEVTKVLLAAGADINTPANGTERTALELAVQAGNKELVELFLAANANSNAPATDSVSTAFYYARNLPSGEILEMLEMAYNTHLVGCCYIHLS